MTFSSFTARWSQTILPLSKPATGATVRSHLARLNAEFGQIDVASLDYVNIQKFFSGAATQNSPKTVRNLWSTMHLILNQAKREGLIAEIPKPVLPRNRRSEQDCLTADQMRQVVSAAVDPYAILFALLAETGLRIGEALGLQARDLDLIRKILTVRRSVYAGKPQDPKTQSSFRTICLSSRMADLLGKLDLDRPEAYVFRTSKGTPFQPNFVLVRGLHPVLVANGIPKCGFHAARRGNATVMATIGVPQKIAAMRLGHGLPDLTFGLYAQIIPETDREWVERIADVIF